MPPCALAFQLLSLMFSIRSYGDVVDLVVAVCGGHKSITFGDITHGVLEGCVRCKVLKLSKEIGQQVAVAIAGSSPMSLEEELIINRAKS